MWCYLFHRKYWTYEELMGGWLVHCPKCKISWEA